MYNLFFISYNFMKGEDIMKQIIPFQKELLFKTKVSEITSISLEHTLSLSNDDFISGEFHISGDYKMTEGSIQRENFDFKIPFDIALDGRYQMNSIVIDIDNFSYEVVDNESLKVNIDVYVEGEKMEEDVIENQDEVIDDSKEVVTSSDESRDEKEEVTDVLENKNPPSVCIEEDEIEESVQYQKPDQYYLDEDKGMEFNIFEDMDDTDTYVTYHVYIVKDSDTIDSITQKYGVTKEEIAVYNDIDDIKAGTKLIIPYHHE